MTTSPISPDAPPPAPLGSAYDLLSKPTLELTDAEVELIIADLQQRRKAYVTSNGKVKDTPSKPKAEPTTAEQRRANTAAIAAAMNLDIEL